MITYRDLERWGACCRDEGERHSRGVLDARYGTGWALSLREVLEDERIRALDRVWVATRPGMLTEEQIAAWVDIFVTRAVRTHTLHCGVPVVEQWAACWLSGVNRSAAQAAVAAVAAWAAQASAARSAAMVALDGGASAEEEARSAAVAASWAARSAAASAAMVALDGGGSASAEEREQQITDLLGILADGSEVEP